VSFLGFVKISAVSEEIKEPSRNLPRTLIGSVILVTTLYALVVLVVAGIFPQHKIVEVGSPLTQAAELVLGPVGAGVMIFAGLLATLSSANASIMAASRINLAMARDRMVPRWLSEIHPRRLTPHRAILITGILAILFLLVRRLEDLAEIASVLQLYGYAAINVGAVVLRAASPDWYRPSYRVPGSPFAQVFAAMGSLGIILYSGVVAQAITVGLIVISLAWYLAWGTSRVKVENGLPSFSAQWSQLGWQVLFTPTNGRTAPEAATVIPALRVSQTYSPRRVMVALDSSGHEAGLLHMGRYIATGRDSGGQVFGVHIVRVPMQTPLEVARNRFAERTYIERTIAALAQRAQPQPGVLAEERPIDQTQFKAVTDVAHDVYGAFLSETTRHQAGLLLVGWRGGFNVSRIYNSPVQRILSNATADVAVLKDRGLENIDSILIPWGGGIHALLGLEIAIRIASATGATVHLLRVVKPEVDAAAEKETLARSLKTLVRDFDRIQYLVRQDESVITGIQSSLRATDYDLVIIGASQEWRIRNVLFGSIPDFVADYAGCSVLMVRRYVPDHWSAKASAGIKRLREAVGLTTSPANSERT
jgi:nucleotide-binding universal stress UspA family protein